MLVCTLGKGNFAIDSMLNCVLVYQFMVWYPCGMGVCLGSGSLRPTWFLCQRILELAKLHLRLSNDAKDQRMETGRCPLDQPDERHYLKIRINQVVEIDDEGKETLQLLFRVLTRRCSTM